MIYYQPEPTRILWLTENYFPNRGGMAQSCDRITYNLRKAGVVVDIFHFTNRRQALQPKAQLGGQYTAVPKEHGQAHTLNRLWNHLSHPNMVEGYSHIVAFGGILPVLAGPYLYKLTDIPLITLVRGNDFDVGIFEPKRKLALKEAFEQSSGIAAVNSDKAWKIEKLFDVKAQFIPNSLVLEDWQPLPSDLEKARNWRTEQVEPRRKVIGVFGDLKPKKGIHFLLSNLKKSKYAQSIHLLLVGNLEEQAADILAQEEIPYSSLPFLDRTELLGYYPACDAIAIPSFYDGMPNILLEAAALEIPILASNVDGIKDFFEGIETKDCLTFHPEDELGLQQCLSRLMESTEQERRRWGSLARARVSRQFTPERESQSYLGLFAEATRRYQQALPPTTTAE